MAGIIGGVVAGITVVLIVGLVALKTMRRSSQKPTIDVNQTKPPGQPNGKNGPQCTAHGDASQSESIAVENGACPPVSEPDYAIEPNVETGGRVSSNANSIYSAVATPIHQSLPEFKDQIRERVGLLAVQPHAEVPQPPIQQSAHSGGGSTSASASASPGKKSTRHSPNDNNSNYEIPMATTFNPVEAQAVVEVEPEISSRPQLEP
jgi:hypothetical protein